MWLSTQIILAKLPYCQKSEDSINYQKKYGFIILYITKKNYPYKTSNNIDFIIFKQKLKLQ